jgi:hypothetical protein
MAKKGGSSSKTRKLKPMFLANPSKLQKMEEDLAKMTMELAKKKLELKQTYFVAKEQIKQGKREELEKRLEEFKKDPRRIKHHTPYFNKARQAIIKGEVMTGKNAQKLNQQLKKVRTTQVNKEKKEKEENNNVKEKKENNNVKEKQEKNNVKEKKEKEEENNNVEEIIKPKSKSKPKPKTRKNKVVAKGLSGVEKILIQQRMEIENIQKRIDKLRTKHGKTQEMTYKLTNRRTSKRLASKREAYKR